MKKRLLSIPHAQTLVVATLAAALTTFAAPLSATADPVPPPGDEHFHEEDGEVSGDPFVEDGDDATIAEPPSEPYALEGLAPDPADLPAEWLKETPAEQIKPSSAESLTLPKGKLTTDAGESTIAVPAPPWKPLPSRLDAAPGWQYSYSCDPNNKLGMVAFAQLISQHYNRPRYSTSRSCKAGNTSQHGEGRAVDWPMNVYDPSDKAIGDAVAYWLTTNNGEMARRFGVQSVIWNKRAWYLYSPGSWRDYNGPSPHTDHVHISFTWDGSMKRTSWWTGTAVTTIDYGTCRVFAGQYAPRYKGKNTRPCSTNLPNPPSSSYPVTLPNASNDNVALAQDYLGFTGSGVDGSFGPNTLSKLLDYQSKRNLPWTGVLDNATWAYMEKNAAAVNRISGEDRYETAAEVASLSPRGSDVYVTTGENYPDALAAGARAGSKNDPILLTRLNSLPSRTIQELQRIQPRKIYVVGGRGAVSSNVARALRPYAGSGGVTRLGGADRYETAATVAAQFGSWPSVAYIATGSDYPDALAAAARAGLNNAPVLLTRKDSLPSATRSALRALNPSRIVVVGSTAAVNTGVARDLQGYASSGSVQRVSGSGLYGTSANIAGYYPIGLDVVYLTTAEDYPDALAGAARGATDAAPILLTNPGWLPTATKDALAYLNPGRITVIGGSKAVSTGVLTQLNTFVD